METPYERGWKQGHWTAELLRVTQSRSAQACLDNLEYHYKVEMKRLDTEMYSDRDGVANHRAYMTGMITHARQDLLALIRLGY